jgi:very-short-patch-repair endonuclease
LVSEQTRHKRESAKHLKAHAKAMRKEPTPAELKFWYAVRDRRLDGLKFRRQVPIGPYIADFLCPDHGIIIELDGGQHAEQMSDDEARDRYLVSQGYLVLRFWNHEVLTSMDGVIDKIFSVLRERGWTSSPSPLSPAKAGERAG